jgi:putative transposase
MGCVKLAKITELGISGPTLCEILKEEGLIKPRKSAERKGKRFRAERPNDMWQIDYVHLGHGYQLLTVKDDCSGKILSSNLRRATKLEDVMDILKECFREHGMPKTILSDHGTQWYAARGGDSRFDEMCSENGIKHIMGRVRHPQTQGKAERFHGVLKEETEINDIADPKEKRKILDEYVLFYNGVRPHWSIGLKVPDSVYYAGT